MQVIMKPLLVIILVISTIIYIFVGGAIIHVLEFDHETATRSAVSRHLDETIQQFLGMIMLSFAIFCVAYNLSL